MPSRRKVIVSGVSALAVASTGGHHAFASSPTSERDPIGGWPTASPESQGIDKAALEAIFDEATKLYALHSIVVVRGGFLIGERYYFPRSASTLSPVNSVTKSVASMLVGIAIEQGKIGSVDQTVGELMPEIAATAPDAAVNRLRLRQLLTQTSGLPNDGNTAILASDPIAYVLGLAVDDTRSPRWVYSNAGSSLISPILERAVSTSMEDFTRTALFTPLGIEAYEWQRDQSGKALSWAGLKLDARDMAKLAWTMADEGRWQGRQVVSPKWVAESTRAHASPTWTVSPVSDIGYGYLWFTGTLQRRMVVWGWGYGSQFALMVPSLRLVIGTLADPPGRHKLRKQNDQVMSIVAQIVELAGRSAG